MPTDTDPGATGAMPAAGTGATGAMPTAPGSAAPGAASSAGAMPTAGATPAAEPTPVAPSTPAATSGSGLEAALAAERRRAAAFEKELKELKDRDLSETEKLRKQVAAHEAEIASRDTREKAAKIKMATISAAAKRGFADPEDAFRLVDAASIELNEVGEPTNVSKLLDDLLKSKPYLAAASARASGSADLGGGSGPAFSKEALAKMTPQQIADNWDKIVAGTGGKIPS